ncbi:MAG: gliding motility-associated C-terminal domain-containing protein [Saprospiraceae bacterium]|nr:gliding motility-associated C-terminal domain-containing protein [Saprospiraceae bacterium]
MSTSCICLFNRGLALLVCLMVICPALFGQTPFDRTGQVFLVLQGTEELVEFSVDNALKTTIIGKLPAGGLNALGFRKTDNFLYGINPQNNHLYRVGKNAVAQDLGLVGLDNTLYYLAGDISPDGKFLASVGVNSQGVGVHLAKTDLDGLGTSFVPLNGNWNLSDIAFDPYSGNVFGFDILKRAVVTINFNSGAINVFMPINGQNNVFGLYFDAFGDLYAYGSTIYGVVDALFSINKNTGIEKLLATGPPNIIADVASCPFSVELKNAVESTTILPCSDVVFRYTIANGSGETLSGVGFKHPLPDGFHFANFLQNPFGAAIDTLSVPGSIIMENLTLAPGVKKISIRTRTDDIPKGKYSSQAVLKNLPALYGFKCISDDPLTARFGDSTSILVNRFDADSLNFDWLICHGDTLILDASDYGNTIQWNNGATSSTLSVQKGGLYTIKAGNVCESVFVSHKVTSTSCPFTIRLWLEFLPDTLFPCDDVTLRFVLDNDSGEPRYNVSLVDVLPSGFSFKKILRNSMGGDFRKDLPPNVIQMEGLSLKVGRDTLDILVEIGDVSSGDYKNRASIHNLPQLMGPIRWSDDPSTFLFDSSSFHLLGVFSDTSFFAGAICQDATITLDASHLGKRFLWEDGSTKPNFVVTSPGEYQLTLLDGCKDVEILWQIERGPHIEVAPTNPISIHQGEQIHFKPFIFNESDTLLVAWTDPFGSSLSCLDCPNPVAMPLQSTAYKIQVSNEICSDTAFIEVRVDKTRRIYAPNVFSPDDDGINDFFYLQSPDEGIIRSLTIFDRWGNALFSSTSCVFNEMSGGWDGRGGGKIMPPGIYLWLAEIEFPDSERKVYSGDVMLYR